MTDDNDKWRPRSLQGGIYCSPDCGFDCTRADYDRAVLDSEALAKRMGEGWKARVWENLGWHYQVQKGVASISPPRRHGSNRYMIYFNTRPQVIKSAGTPEEALSLALQKARSNYTQIILDCDALELGEG